MRRDGVVCGQAGTVWAGAGGAGAVSASGKESANDFSELFRKCPALRTIIFNGGEAEKMFRRHVEGQIEAPVMESLRFVPLPSSSATPGKNVLPFTQKVERWRIIPTL